MISRRGAAAPGYASVFVASAGGAGMMWGPAVGRAVADVALTGTTDVVDLADLGLDRFDASGRSRLAAGPIALPFPEKPAFPGKAAASANDQSRRA
jgi:sarcosine oxidase subunit beta